MNEPPRLRRLGSLVSRFTTKVETAGALKPMPNMVGLDQINVLGVSGTPSTTTSKDVSAGVTVWSITISQVTSTVEIGGT